MGKESRPSGGAKIQDVFGELSTRPESREGHGGYPAGELAESFRKASKALEDAARDVIALRHRVTKPPSG